MATYTNLDLEILSNAALQAFTKVLRPITLFSKNFSAAPGTHGQNILVPLVAALTATTFNGSYAVCGGVKTVVTVVLNKHMHVPVGQNDLDFWNNGASDLETFGMQQGKALGTLVLQDILTLCTTSNFSQSTAANQTSILVPELRKLRLDLTKNDVPQDMRILLLETTPYDTLLSVTNFVQAYLYAQQNVLQEGVLIRALGMDIFECNGILDRVAAASVIGFACHPSAIAVAMRYLAPQPGHNYSEARPVTDPETGLTIGLRDHYDENTGARYVNLECNYGYSRGLSGAGRLVRDTNL